LYSRHPIIDRYSVVSPSDSSFIAFWWVYSIHRSYLPRQRLVLSLFFTNSIIWPATPTAIQHFQSTITITFCVCLFHTLFTSLPNLSKFAFNLYMFDFGDELVLEGFRIPWLIWIQLIVLLLLLAFLFCITIIASDHTTADSPSTLHSTSSVTLNTNPLQITRVHILLS
jgi:hypothetical protein